MADNFSFNLKSSQKFSHGDSKEVTDYANLGFSPEFCATENEETTICEKHGKNHQNLEERLKHLQSTMVVLKKQLAEERYKWKQQLDEILQHESATCEQQTDNLTSDAKDSEVSEDIQSHVTDLTSPEYEATLTEYQDALVKAQAEKKANLRRQISINNYKRHLLEVENMCNLELLRVKQNVQFLQPLRMIASEWNSRNEDTVMDELTTAETQESCMKDYSEISKPEGTAVEPLGNRFCNEMNALFTKLQYCNMKIPHINTTSAVWQVGDDIVGVEHTNSTMWCSPDLTSPATKISPF